MKRMIFASAICLIFFQTTAFCQTGSDAVTTAVSNLKTLLTDHISEKAYLHFDRPYPYYVAGEVVYFKAYVLMGERHAPGTLSNILHVDLIDPNNVLLQTISLQLTGGTGWGDFALSDTLQKGSYRIRAYTEWMRNDPHPHFFDQYISVSSVNNVDQVANNTAQALKPDLQFFPEGGNMVVDVPSKVAFKAIGTNGLGIDVAGVVVDNENKEVAKIVTSHLGMGEFSFIPEEGKSYKAMVTFAGKSPGSIDLPAAQAKGITLSVNTDDPSKVSIGIRANRAYYKENLNKQLNLLVYYGGALKRFTPKLEGEVLGLDLPARAFPTGVLKVSLLSETGEPLNERLAFTQNSDLLNLEIAANKQAFTTRENVQLNLDAKNPDGSPAMGSFSVAVVDESKILVDDNAENTILSYILLGSEVKGYIEKPNFYFVNVTKETRADLDMLMLTQGYRRFAWKEIENNQPVAAITFKPEKGIDISGVLKNKAGAPITDCTITLLPQPSGALQTQTTDNDGKFSFPNVDLSSGTKFILKTQASSAKNSVLTLDKSTQAPLITMGNPLDSKYNANADILASLQNNQRQGVMTASSTSTTVVLKDESVSNTLSRNNYRSSGLGGSGHASQVVLGNEIKDMSSLSLALKGLLHGISFIGDVPYLQTSITISGSAPGSGSQGAEPMLVVIDGETVTAPADIDVVNPITVEAVEVLSGANASIYGMEGGQGVLVITTRQGIEKDEVISKTMSPGIFSIEPRGYFKALEFYSPRYDANPPAGNRPDERTTIFWKPDVITDAGGKASFNFFNADGKGTYRVEVEGIDGKGNIGMQVLRYKVE